MFFFVGDEVKQNLRYLMVELLKNWWKQHKSSLLQISKKPLFNHQKDKSELTNGWHLSVTKNCISTLQLSKYVPFQRQNTLERNVWQIKLFHSVKLRQREIVVLCFVLFCVIFWLNYWRELCIHKRRTNNLWIQLNFKNFLNVKRWHELWFWKKNKFSLQWSLSLKKWLTKNERKLKEDNNANKRKNSKTNCECAYVLQRHILTYHWTFQ